MTAPLRFGFALALLALFAGCDGGAPEPPTPHLVGVAATHPELTRLSDAVSVAGLSPSLQGGTWTLFAPSDDAFRRLGGDAVQLLLDPSNSGVAARVLRRHLVPGEVPTSALVNGASLQPLEGPPLEVTIEDEVVYVGGAALTATDVEASNGVLHVVDGLFRDHLTTLERLRTLPLASDFLEAARSVHRIEDIATPDHTLFIPLNSAYREPGADVHSRLIYAAYPEVSEKVADHHVVAGRQIGPGAFAAGERVETAAGTERALSVRDGSLYVGDLRVVIGPVETADGTLYFLNDLDLSPLLLSDWLRLDRRYSSFFEFAEIAGLADLLSGGDPVTVFAAQNPSIASLGDALVAGLRADPDHLRRTIAYHIVPGRVEPEELLEAPTLTTLDGEPLPSNFLDADLFIGGRARVSFPPLEARNGLIYEITRLNRPPSLSLAELALWRGATRYLNLLKSVGLVVELERNGPYTVFAPTNDALNATPPVSDPDRLRALLAHHIVQGEHPLSTLSEGQTLETLAGREVTVMLAADTVLLDGVPVASSEADDQATNGRLYLLDGVLSPDG